MEIFLKISNDSEKKNLLKLNFPVNDSENYVEESFDLLEQTIGSRFGLSSSEYVISTNYGIEIKPGYTFQNGQTLQLCLKVLGGKGGFGSLLRAFGKQITMSTDKGACRDLTGRRIRHVNNEKKLKDFLTNQAELKKQKEQEKKEKEERRKKKRDKIEAKHHMFVDPKYDEQKQKIAEDLDQAISKGIDSKKSEKLADTEKLNELPKTSSSEQTKPIETKQKATTSKMLEDWMGVGDLDVSSSSEDEEVAPVKKAKRA